VPSTAPDNRAAAATSRLLTNDDWTDAMMKSSDKSGFAFNNVADSILKTRNVLLRKIGLPLPSEKKKEVANKAA
jgi:hypothetical protein